MTKDEAPACPISQRPTANEEAVRVLDLETGIVWKWKPAVGWTRAGRYYEIDADLDDAIIRYKKPQQPS